MESAKAFMEDIRRRNPEAETLALSTSELRELLACYGIDPWPALFAATEDEAVAEADELGWPVALKSLDPRLRNRGAFHGVRLSLENEESLRAAYLSLTATLDADARSQLVVQQTAPSGIHCVIRSTEDPVFGPVVSFGLGGTIPQLLDDHAYQVPPITDLDAARLLRTPGSAKLLFGYGGNSPVDVLALQDLVVRVGLMADDFPEITRLDLNPVIASPRTGCDRRHGLVAPDRGGGGHP